MTGNDVTGLTKNECLCAEDAKQGKECFSVFIKLRINFTVDLSAFLMEVIYGVIDKSNLR